MVSVPELVNRAFVDIMLVQITIGEGGVLEFDYRAEAASLLSRGAATECSPGRKPGEHVVLEVKPRRGEISYGICRTYGAHARKGRNPRACARGYILSPLRGFNRMRFARHFGQQ